MEDLPHEILAVLTLLAVVALPSLLAGLWVLRRRHQRRRAVEAMRRGNEIYGEWRGNNSRKSID
jgi:hypothetical protein